MMKRAAPDVGTGPPGRRDGLEACYRDAVLNALGGAVERIVPFGSRARGDADADSDWDFAVFLAHDATATGALPEHFETVIHNGYDAMFHAARSILLTTHGKASTDHGRVVGSFARFAGRRGAAEAAGHAAILRRAHELRGEAVYGSADRWSLTPRTDRNLADDEAA